MTFRQVCPANRNPGCQGADPRPFGQILIFLPRGRIFRLFDIWYTIQLTSTAAAPRHLGTRQPGATL
jgi:hypothetical protein